MPALALSAAASRVAVSTVVTSDKSEGFQSPLVRETVIVINLESASGTYLLPISTPMARNYVRIVSGSDSYPHR